MARNSHSGEIGAPRRYFIDRTNLLRAEPQHLQEQVNPNERRPTEPAIIAKRGSLPFANQTSYSDAHASNAKKQFLYFKGCQDTRNAE